MVGGVTVPYVVGARLVVNLSDCNVQQLEEDQETNGAQCSSGLKRTVSAAVVASDLYSYLGPPHARPRRGAILC